MKDFLFEINEFETLDILDGNHPPLCIWYIMIKNMVWVQDNQYPFTVRLQLMLEWVVLVSMILAEAG